MPNPLFTADFKPRPYWWDTAPRPPAERRLAPPPARVDVAVIGSGYTGLHAALQTARAGRSTLVLDAEALGWGCSSRNGGQLGNGLKPSHAELCRLHGSERALALRRESLNALDYTSDFIRAEGVDCDFEACGRFHAAHNPASYESLARELQTLPRELGVEWNMVARGEQHREVASDAYHGGCVFPQHAAFDPGRYHLGLLRLAAEAGVALVSHCPVEGLQRQADGFLLSTQRGEVVARDVIVASNGYTGKLTPWLRRRVIPIGSYIIATEPLAPELTARLLPSGRVVSDTRRVVYYYRLSPDRRRMLFGGRVAFNETDVRNSAPRLHRDMCALFPELTGARVSHSWMGFVAYTFDHLPHLGVVDGAHYALGYCGSGAALSGYLGMRIGQRVLGSEQGHTALDDIMPQTRPGYAGDPWFLGAAIAWHRLRDRMSF